MPPVLHVPWPSHLEGPVSMPFEQAPAPQDVSEGCSLQAPAPSQVPSRPQVVMLSAEHSFPGSLPAGTGVQDPFEPARSQAWQVPVQAELQHTLSAQNPVMHSPAALQAAPAGWRPAHFMVAPSQKELAAHPLLFVHDVPQTAPAQTYGSHALVVPAWQVPMPSQVRTEVSVAPLQARAAHSVPAANSRQAPLPSQVPSRPQVVAASLAQLSLGS